MTDEEQAREVTPLTFWKPGDPGWAGVSKDMRPADGLMVDPVVDPSFTRPIHDVTLPEQPEEASKEAEAPPVPDALAGDDDEDDAYGRDT